MMQRMSLGKQTIGPWIAELEQLRGPQNGKTILRAVFPRNSYPNFVSAGVSVISAVRTAAVAPQELKGSSHFLNAALPLPPEAGQPSIRRSMRGHNGQEYSASFKTREWHNQPESAGQRDMTYEAPREIRFVFCAFVMIAAIIVAIWFRYIG